MNNQVAFKLDWYRFIKATLNFDIPKQAELTIAFKPSGKYYEIENRYELSFETDVYYESKTTINVSCIASFTFNKDVKFDDIPDFFYPNSLAILFPYIRAFVSTLTLQANTSPLILPTVNLIGLTDELRQNTSIIE